MRSRRSRTRAAIGSRWLSMARRLCSMPPTLTRNSVSCWVICSLRASNSSTALLGGAHLLLQFGLARFRFAQACQNRLATLLLLGVLLFDRLQLEHDRVDLAFEVAAFGGQRVEFAFFRGEGDFLGVEIGAESGKLGFERGFLLFQLGLGHFLTRDLRWRVARLPA